MPPDTLHELREHLSQPCAVEQAQLPEHICRVLRSLHTDTYFQIQGQSDCCHTSVGSRPGDCFADVVFSFLFSRVMKAFQTKLQDAGLQESVGATAIFDPFANQEHPPATRPYLGPIWMDDLCVGLRGNTPQGLVQKAGVVTSLLLETLESFGMTPNLKKGKTELLLSLRGRGVRKAKKQIFGPNSPGTLPIVCELETKSISVVGQYQHLGGILHHQGDHRVEMKRRVAIAHAAFNAHRKIIFQNTTIPLIKRIELFRTLVISKLTYGSESWVLVDRRSKEFLHAAIMRLYRRLLNIRPDQHCPDVQILNQLQLPTPTELLRQARLRYLGTLHACTEVVTWDLLNHDQSWCDLIRDDLMWMWTQLSNSSSLPSPHSNLDPWRYLWTFHRSYWKGLIKRAMQHAILQRHNTEVVRQGHAKVLNLLRSSGKVQLPSDEQDQRENNQPVMAYGCMVCQMSFRSKGGEGAHMCRKHGIISSLRYLFDHTRCEICMKEYFTFGKLHNHLRYSRQCREGLQRRQYQCDPVGGHGSQIDGQLSQQHDGLLPPLMSHGPRPQPPRQREVEDFDIELYGECSEVLLSEESPDEKQSQIRQRVSNKAISWTYLSHTLRTLRDNAGADDFDAFGMQPHEFHAMFHDLMNPDSWPFMKQTEAQLEATSTVADLEWQCANVTRQENTLSQPSPRGFGRHRFILHAFSGRRRQGDFQFFLDAVTQDHPGMVIHTLSVDILLDSKWGDVSDESVQNFWISAARQRWVVAFLGGPPCETWSRAREHVLADECSRGPRVVRTAAQPWGLDSLALREIRQVLVGNQLILFAIMMLTILYDTGGCGAMEHPARPPKEASASIWGTSILEMLQSLEGFHLWQLAQGLLGAVSAKPTMVLTLNLPSFGVQVCRWRVTHELPKQVSIGRGHDGKFSTMVLKEYPPAFCGALATSFWHALQGFPMNPEVQIPGDFFALCSSMLIQEFGDEIGPDFAGGA